MTIDWTSALHEALAGADRLDVHDTVNIPLDALFSDEPGEPAPERTGIGPDSMFEPAPSLQLTGVEKITGLVARIRIDDAKSGSHCMCTGGPWLRFFRRGREIASFTWHHGKSLRWHGGPWPDDGALTEDAADAVPAWFLAEGFPQLHHERETEIAAQRRAREEQERLFADLPPEVLAELLE